MMIPRAPVYPRKRSRVVWGFLECMCFCGLAGSWDLLFKEFEKSNLIFYEANCSTTDASTEYTPALRDAWIQNRTKGAYLNLNGTALDVLTENCSLCPCISRCDCDVITSRVVPGLTSLLTCIFIVPLGLLYKKEGTLKTRLIAIVMFTVATLLMAFSTPKNAWLAAVSWFLLSLSGVVTLVTVLQVANLSRTKRSLITMSYIAAKECSAWIVFLIKMTAEYSSIQSSFMFLTVGVVPLLVGTIAFLPKSHLTWPPQLHYPQGGHTLNEHVVKRRPRGFKLQDRKSRRPSVNWAVSELYWSQVTWFCVLVYSLKMAEDISVIRLLHHGDTGRVYRHISFGCLASIITCPLVGIALDIYSKFKEENKRRRVFMISLCCVTSILWILSLSLIATSHIDTQSLNTVRIAISRGLMCVCAGCHLVALSTLFPYEHFGVIFGVSTVFSELSTLLSYVVLWTTAKGWVPLSVVLIINLLVVAASSVHLFFKWRHRNSPELTSFKTPNFIMETIARATIMFEGAPSLNSIDTSPIELN